MKNDKKITENAKGNGVYVMDFKKESLQARGSNSTERLKNAVNDFLKSTQRKHAAVSHK